MTSKMDAAIDKIASEFEGRPFVLLIMPRDIGNHGPDIPRGHSKLWSMAEAVAVWDRESDSFEIAKSPKAETAR